LLQFREARATSITYFHEDQLGSTRLGRTGSTTTQQISFMPFGSVYSQSGSQLRNTFTGQEFDAETGLYYYGARYYDPTIGRFLEPDPLVADPTDPQSLNRYTYVRNNPASNIDPTGATDLYLYEESEGYYGGGGSSFFFDGGGFGFMFSGGSGGFGFSFSFGSGGGGGVSMVPVSGGTLIFLPPGAYIDYSGVPGAGAGAVAVPPTMAGSPGAAFDQSLQGSAIRSGTVGYSGPGAFSDDARRDAVIAGGGSSFPVSENPNADATQAWHEVGALGNAAVRRYGKEIDAATALTGVDPDLLRTAIYMENSRGWYDAVGGPLRQSIRPANINVNFWGQALGLTRAQLNDPAMNILAGARILSGIQANVQGGNIRAIGTLYNKLGATTVTNYGARFGAIYSIQPWGLP
jgi:RHS repeat-associated protein